MHTIFQHLGCECVFYVVCTRMCAEFDSYYNDACTCMSGCLLGNHVLVYVHPTTDCVHCNRLCVYTCIWGLFHVELGSFV